MLKQSPKQWPCKKFRAPVIFGPGKRNKSAVVAVQKLCWSFSTIAFFMTYDKYEHQSSSMFLPASTIYCGFLSCWKQQCWLNLLAVPSKTDLIQPAACLLYPGAPTPSIKATWERNKEKWLHSGSDGNASHLCSSLKWRNCECFTENQPSLLVPVSRRTLKQDGLDRAPVWDDVTALALTDVLGGSSRKVWRTRDHCEVLSSYKYLTERNWVTESLNDLCTPERSGVQDERQTH